MAFLIPENLKSRKDVSDAFRRVAQAFAVAFDGDTTLWFEPLFDPSGELPHFVVLEPRIGIVVLEVFKGKDRSKLLGAIRGKLRIEVNGEEIEVDSPLERAERMATSLRDRLADHDQLADVPVGAVAVFSGIDDEEAARLGVDRIVDPRVCVFKTALDDAIHDAEGTGIEKALRRALPHHLDDELVEHALAALRGVIHPDVLIQPQAEQGALFAGGEAGASGDVMKVMDRKQEAMAKNLGSGHRLIRGVAGSGKTLVLVQRARLMARLLPNHKILVTCYTKALASQLRALLAEHPNVEVVNLDKLMARVIRNAGLRHPGYKDGDRPVAQAALSAIQASTGTRYRAVMVDEAQDFDTEALQFCVELLEATNSDEQDLVVVADSAQNIFRKNFRWKDAGIRAQGRTQLLRVNYRDTREILEFAHSFLAADPNISLDDVPDADDELAIIPAKSAERSGEPPSVTVVDSLADEVAAVVDQVNQVYSSHSRSRSIAVLHGDQTPGEKGHRARMLARAFEDAGIPHLWATDHKHPQNRELVGSTDEAVILSTIQSAKGLEFPHTIVCGLGVRDDELTARKLLYVGFTRAVDRLTVVTTRSSPFRNDLERAAGLVSSPA